MQVKVINFDQRRNFPRIKKLERIFKKLEMVSRSSFRA
jgi:hypothetical protein